MPQNNKTLEKAPPHTIKKFELIEEYVKAWAQKLLNLPLCSEIVFIDCMCNSGLYQDEIGREVHGTPIRVATYLSDIMKNYPNKKCMLFLNDIDGSKIDVLAKHLPCNAANFFIKTSSGDGNKLLKAIGNKLSPKSETHYLLVYDPYQAVIDWEALSPFLKHWGEIIINHMVSDSIRGVSQAKKDAVIDKYEQTYRTEIEELIALGSDRNAFEKRIKDIIAVLKGATSRKYYIGSFPFFNTTNNLIYNLIHCSGSEVGFNLYKTTAWKVFGGKSSTKKSKNIDGQLSFGMEFEIELASDNDENCYSVSDIAIYLSATYKGQTVKLSDMWQHLYEHPVFPVDGYKNEVKKLLKDFYNVSTTKDTITFND